MALDDVRREIDRLDDQIVALLARRQRQVVRAAAFKVDDAAVRAPDRRAQLMARLHERAVEEGADPQVVAAAYTAMIDAFVELELRELRVRRVASGSPYEATIGFSRAVRAGDRVLVSGTAPVFPDGSCPPDPGVQARRCLEIIAVALREAGASLADVVRTRTFLTDAAHADAVGAVHGEAFGDVRPAATMVVVAGLLDPRWLVEIEAEAQL